MNENKLSRLNKVSVEAAKQCGRSVIPEVTNSITFKEALIQAQNDDLILFCYEGDRTESLGNILKKSFTAEDTMPKSIAIFIGSEGGFSQAEADAAKKEGFLMAGLGRRILRTETASPFVLGALVYEFEL